VVKSPECATDFSRQESDPAEQSLTLKYLPKAPTATINRQNSGNFLPTLCAFFFILLLSEAYAFHAILAAQSDNRKPTTDKLLQLLIGTCFLTPMLSRL